MILLVEPQCWGDEHVEVNAALLLTVRRAFPEQDVTFLAEPGHLAAVRGRVGGAGEASFQPIRIAPRPLSEPRRFRIDAALVRHVIGYGRDHGVRELFFCSATSAVIFSAKWYGRRSPGLAITAVLHRNLSTLASVESYRPWHYLLRLSSALRCPDGDRMRYLVYGDYIREEVRRVMPRLAPRIIAVDHPYRFDLVPVAAAPDAGEVTFGFLGTGRLDKGADLFFRLARDAGSSVFAARSRFLLVGHLWDPGLAALRPPQVELAAQDGAMLQRERYQELAHSLSFAVFCCQAEPYRYFASGALLDAFAFVKPVIALRTPMIEYCFRRMGDIGYLCDSYAEMSTVVQGLLERPDPARYRAQCDNIRNNRKIFSPEVVAASLRREYLRGKSQGNPQ